MSEPFPHCVLTVWEVAAEFLKVCSMLQVLQQAAEFNPESGEIAVVIEMANKKLLDLLEQEDEDG